MAVSDRNLASNPTVKVWEQEPGKLCVDELAGESISPLSIQC